MNPNTDDCGGSVLHSESLRRLRASFGGLFGFYRQKVLSAGGAVRNSSSAGRVERQQPVAVVRHVKLCVNLFLTSHDEFLLGSFCNYNVAPVKLDCSAKGEQEEVQRERGQLMLLSRDCDCTTL